MLLVMPLAAGCIIGGEVIFPDIFGNRCERDEEVDESFKTALGTVDLIEVTGSCSDAGTYRLDGPENLLDEIEFKEEPDDLKFTVRKPWLRVSARVDGKKKVWDFVAAKDGLGQLNGAQCKTPVLGAKRPSLEACLGPNLVQKQSWGRWAFIAYRFDDETVFDEHARALILEHRDDPVQILRGIKYYDDTWVLEPDSHVVTRRTADEQAAVRSLLEEVGCEPMVGASAEIWTFYVDMVQRIMGERADELLHPCVERLLGNWAEQPASLRPLLDKDGVVEKLDAAIVSQPERVNVGVMELWSARLQQSPRPSQQLVDAMDQRLAAALPESSQAVAERLESEVPIAAPNAERLAAAVSECCLVDDVALKVRARNEIAPHRDALDHSFVDVLVRNEVSKDERTALRALIEQSEKVPFGVDVRTRLERVLLDHLEALDAEVLLLIEYAPSQSVRDEFVAAFDLRLGQTYPIGSQAFLGRLEQALLPRPSESSRRAIVERARAVKRAGEPIDGAACEVLRAVLMLPNDRGTCGVPEEF
jgi:hypothetical protein